MVVPAPLVRKGMVSEVTSRTRRWRGSCVGPKHVHGAVRGAAWAHAQRVRVGPANAVRHAWRGQERGSQRPANKTFERAT
jgi:hypothetical protein